MSFKNKLNLSNKRVLYSFIPMIDTHTHALSLQNKLCVKNHCGLNAGKFRNQFFKNKFRIKINYPETILYRNEVIHIITGNINGKEVINIVNKVREV